jgi:S-DNA-T family DNA segregation ATPase FtsK/SpoIIIE
MISDLSRRHLQLLGNANSGRTTALLAAATGLAATHKPGDLEFILFDFGYSLKTLSGLPHNTIYFAASEEKERKAMLDDLLKEMNRRREAFGEVEKGVIISNLSDYRKYRQPKLKPEDELETAIVLVIDNFSYWRRSPDYDMCAHVLRNLIQAGPVYGIHILLTADKYTDIDYGRYWESFYSVMLQMDHADLFSQPQDKKMLALWNNKPGRGFVKGDPPRNLIEVQAFFLTTEPEKLQQAAVGKLVQEMFAVHKG